LEKTGVGNHPEKKGRDGEPGGVSGLYEKKSLGEQSRWGRGWRKRKMQHLGIKKHGQSRLEHEGRCRYHTEKRRGLSPKDERGLGGSEDVYPFESKKGW